MSKLKLHDKNVIGLDETNNGYHLNQVKERRDFPLIITGYLTMNMSRNHLASFPYGGHRPVFTEKINVPNFVNSARIFLRAHPDFLYTIIPESEMKKKHPIERNYLRALATSSVISRFFRDYSLSEEKTIVLLDNIDSRDTSEAVVHTIRAMLKEISGLEVEVGFKNGGDESVMPIKNAHVIGRYIGGLRLHGKMQRWPYLERKVDRRQILQEAIIK